MEEADLEEEESDKVTVLAINQLGLLCFTANQRNVVSFTVKGKKKEKKKVKLGSIASSITDWIRL